MAHKIMNDTDPVVGFEPVRHDKPAPGGSQNNTPPSLLDSIGNSIRNAITSGTQADKVTKALK